MSIRYEPAECAHGCHVPDCPYTHEESWFVGAVSFQTRAEAEAFVAALNETERQLQAGLDTLTNR